MSERRGMPDVEVTLLAQERRSIRAERLHLLGEVAVAGLVVGVKVGDWPILKLHGYAFEEIPAVEETLWPQDQAEHLYDLYARLCASPDGPGDIDCYGFIDEIMGWPAGTAQDSDYRGVNPNRLQPGVPYGVRQAIGLSHAMMGLSNPNHVLGISGKKRPGRIGGGQLIIQNPQDALTAYGGEAIVQLDGPA
jgi:hypothetical protein